MSDITKRSLVAGAIATAVCAIAILPGISGREWILSLSLVGGITAFFVCKEGLERGR